MNLIDIEKLPLEAVSHNPKVRKHNLLAPGAVPHVTLFSIAYFPPGEVAPAHAHPDMLEIFMVRSGAGVIRVQNQPYSLRPGRCVVVEPHEAHEIENTGQDPLEIQCLGVRVA